MTRHRQWEQRLGAFIEKNLDRPHAYGRFDCVLMPLGAAQAVTGKDHGRGHRGKYKTALEAARYLKKLGFDSPAAALDSVFEEKPVGFAQRGDMVLCKTEAGDNPGFVDTTGKFALVVGMTPEREGLIRVPRGDLWLKAWAVG